MLSIRGSRTETKGFFRAGRHLAGDRISDSAFQKSTRMCIGCKSFESGRSNVGMYIQCTEMSKNCDKDNSFSLVYHRLSSSSSSESRSRHVAAPRSPRVMQEVTHSSPDHLKRGRPRPRTIGSRQHRPTVYTGNGQHRYFLTALSTSVK